MLGLTDPLPTKGESLMVLKGRATCLEIVNNPLSLFRSIPNDYFVILWLNILLNTPRKQILEQRIFPWYNSERSQGFALGKGIGIPESGKILIVESGIMAFGIQNTAKGI